MHERRRGRPRQVVVDPKRVYLTPEAVELVAAFADRQGMNFSAAVETLCRLVGHHGCFEQLPASG